MRLDALPPDVTGKHVRVAALGMIGLSHRALLDSSLKAGEHRPGWA
jgi:hypothetical protein